MRGQRQSREEDKVWSSVSVTKGEGGESVKGRADRTDEAGEKEDREQRLVW